MAVFGRLVNEVRRRQLLPVFIAYVAVGWLILQVSAVVFPAFEIPDAVLRNIVYSLIIAAPFVMTLAWFFNVTLHGIVRLADLGHMSGEESPSKLIKVLLADEKQIASVSVLPFENLSSQTDDAGLADGLASEIHSTLSQMHHVRVGSRRSAFRFRDSDKSLTEIAAALNVRYLLSGNLMQHGNQVRVIAELDDALNDAQLWSQKYERSADDLFAIQSEIAQAVVGAFGVAREKADIDHAKTRPTRSIDAWTLVQKARDYINDFSEDTLKNAEKSLRRALKLDKNYAIAHAALGAVLVEQVLNGYAVDAEASRRQALEAITTARQLAPDDPFVLKNAGMVLAAAGDVPESIKALRKCVNIAPFEFGAWGYFGWPLSIRGEARDIEEIDAVMTRLLEAAPEHPGAPYWLYHQSVAASLGGDNTRAIELMQQAVKKHTAPPWACMHLANLKAATGDLAGARAMLAQAKRLNPHMTVAHYTACIGTLTGDDSAANPRLSGLRDPKLQDAR